MGYQLCSKTLLAVFFSVSTVLGQADFQFQQRLVSGGAADDYANIGVAISGSTAIVAASNGYYVYVRSGTTWTQQTILVPSDGMAGCGFPRNVTLSGAVAAVGCTGSLDNQGAVYIFVRSGTIWTEQQRLTASDGAPGDRFGREVAISGDTLVAGAIADDIGGNTDQGSAYVFVRNGSTWTEQQKLIATDGGARNLMGVHVAIDGDTVLISRSGHSLAVEVDPAVYIFVRSGTTWQQQQKLRVCEPSASGLCNFGSGIAVKGDVAAIGNQYLNVNSNTGQGGLYVFTRSGTSWAQQQRLTAADGAANDYFGGDTAIEGQTLVISAYADIGVPGKAYVYGRSGNTWSFQQKIQPTATRNAFSQDLAFDGTSIIFSAPLDAGSPGAFIGAAYIYARPVPSVRSPFDFDGDGKTDIGIFRPAGGASEWWINRSSTGATFALVFGASTDRIAPADYTGDGKADIAFFRPSSGEWYVLRSEDFSFFAFPFGTDGDVPVPADYDADGKSDAGVFRPSSATWFIRRSSDGGTTIEAFGANGDVPVPADYDGDGRADLAIFRPTNGQWWLNRSTAGVIATTFGDGADKPVQGDYTGDGKSDIAFWRPSTGDWYVLRSEDFSFFSFPFGTTGDVPAPGDYDGDGKHDAAVFRGSNATWYLNRSTAGTLIVQFGATGDRPIPNAFVP